MQQHDHASWQDLPACRWQAEQANDITGVCPTDTRHLRIQRGSVGHTSATRRPTDITHQDSSSFNKRPASMRAVWRPVGRRVRPPRRRRRPSQAVDRARLPPHATTEPGRRRMRRAGTGALVLALWPPCAATKTDLANANFLRARPPLARRAPWRWRSRPHQPGCNRYHWAARIHFFLRVATMPPPPPHKKVPAHQPASSASTTLPTIYSRLLGSTRAVTLVTCQNARTHTHFLTQHPPTASPTPQRRGGRPAGEQR